MTGSRALAKLTVRLVWLLVWEGPAAGQTTPLGTLPATFTDAQRQVELYPDQTYVLRVSGDHDDIGRWSLENDDRTLVLRGLRPAPLAVPIAELHRSERLQPLEPRLTLRGVYQTATATFTDCLTGKSWPVARDRQNAALETAGGKVRREELMVSVDGRLAMRPRMDGARPQPTLIVERVEKVSPGESCGALSAGKR